MKVLARHESYDVTPEALFKCIDDLGVTGMHMTEPSVIMMGSKLQLEYLTIRHTGTGTIYRWWGRVIGMPMDFTTVVSKWVYGKEKIWETFGDARMIIFSWYQMRLVITSPGGKTNAELTIRYRRPRKLFYKFLSFLLANWYCRWCLRSMLDDSREILEHVGNYEKHDKIVPEISRES